MIPMTEKLRQKVTMYIKNKMDISELIANIDIKGENLSYAIIENFNRTGQNLSGTKFTYAVIGKEGITTNLSNNKFRDCDFSNTHFLGTIFLRKCDCRGSSFQCAWLHNVEYQYSDIRQCNFCEAILRLGSDYGYKAKVDRNIFLDLTKWWNIRVSLKDDDEEQKNKEKENNE